MTDAELQAFGEVARTQNLTNDQAQVALTALPAQLAASASRYLAAAEKHPEVGGAHFEQTKALAAKVLDRFLPAGTPDGDAFRRGMDASGMGNWAPALVLLARIGKAMSEDAGLAAGAAPTRPRSAIETLYGSQP